MTIAVVDFGTGNLHSVAKALERVSGGGAVVVTARAADIDAADRLVLPGQGAIGTWLEANRGELARAVRRGLRERPVLGICLGLQALFEHSEEGGGVAGLGVLDGSVRRFRPPPGSGLKVPHMGWNNVMQRRPHPLWSGIPDGTRFYFVHSYYVLAECEDERLAEAEYGVRFTAAAGRHNVVATQFHPEKSAAAGLRLLENFVAWRP